jgi:hypothetical protein
MLPGPRHAVSPEPQPVTGVHRPAMPLGFSGGRLARGFASQAPF